MRFSWLLVPALAATVAVRLALATEPPVEDGPRLLVDLSALLAAQGFATSVDVRDGPDAVLATRPGCALAVVADQPANGGDDLFARRYGTGRDVRLFYQDRFIASLPRWQATWNYYRQRHLSRLGFDPAYPPLLRIAATPGCDLGSVAWHRLRFHPVPSTSD